MSTAAVWHIGQWLNAVQTAFVGLLRVWSVPIVLMLSIASGYTTYYGLSYFITAWIALVITVAVQSIVVICTLELAGMHWRANPLRFLMVGLSLLVALAVSISFSYFKFYEFSQRDSILTDRQGKLEQEINRYLESVVGLRSQITAAQLKRIEHASNELTQAYLGVLPAMQGELRHQIGKGKVWSHYNEILQAEQASLKQMEPRFQALEQLLAGTRASLRDFSLSPNSEVAYTQLILAFQSLQSAAESLLSEQGVAAIPAPRLGSHAEFIRGVTPSFAMWEDISWFALACASMVDFFVLVLSYRLEFTAPGPLTEEEKDLAYQGLRQFNEFTINKNDELEFIIERTELERARRFSDWSRMFAVALLLNRGYLRKMSDRAVEFAPNLYPLIAERMSVRKGAELRSLPGTEDKLAEALKRKSHG